MSRRLIGRRLGNLCDWSPPPLAPLAGWRLAGWHLRQTRMRGSRANGARRVVGELVGQSTPCAGNVLVKLCCRQRNARMMMHGR